MSEMFKQWAHRDFIEWRKYALSQVIDDSNNRSHFRRLGSREDAQLGSLK